MRLVSQLFWIFIFSFIGEAFSILCSDIIAIPGSVIGMLLLFIALHYKWIRIRQIDEAGSWLSDNMAVFFVPAGVGLMTQFDALKGNTWWQLLIIIIISTLLMLALVSKIVQLLLDKSKTQKTGDDFHV